MEGRDKWNNKQESSANKNLRKLVNVFDDGLTIAHPHSPAESPRPGSVSRKELENFKVPTVGPNTQTRIPGKPIDLNTAKALRTVTLGYPSNTYTTDWKKFYFCFREPKSDIPYGLDASFPGPRALTLCVQAWVLKNLMFSPEKLNDDKQFLGKASPKPTQLEQTNALVDAVVDILWKAALPTNKKKIKENKENADNQPEKRQVVITLVGFETCFLTKRAWVEDGFTEKMWIYTMHTLNDLKKFVRRNIHYFCHRMYPGAVMLLYSVVLTRSVDVILKDMGRLQGSLLTDNSRTTQALVNLLLTGNAAPFLHNGVIRCDSKGQALEHPLPGICSRSEIGFLYFNKNESEKNRTQVGSMYRTPLVPIWITKVNGTYGLLFCTARDLVTDWKTERYFSLHYYNGHFTQKTETILTLDTRTRVEVFNPDRQISIWDDEEEKEKKQPSLENLIFTKWPQADVDWNGETPYY